MTWFLGSIYAQTNVFEITFDIKGIQSKSASVHIFGNRDAVTFEEKEMDVEIGDRTRTVKGIEIENGKFVFRGTTTEPVVARIWLNNDRQLSKVSHGGRGTFPVKSEQIWVIVYPGATFSVAGDITGKDYMSVNAKDGGENDYFAEMAQKKMPLISQMGNISVANSNPNIDSNERKQNQQKLQELSAELEKVKLDFLNSRTNSIAALWLMEDMLTRSEITPEALAPILAKVDKTNYGKSHFYKAVSDRISGAFATSVGQMVPNIETDDTYDGTPFSLTDMKGKYVIIDFWGSWCGPCISGMPNLKAFRDKHQDKLQILGISNDRTQEVWRSAIERLEMNWPNIIIGRDDKNFVSKFNVQAFPTMLLISPEGKILLRETGSNKEFYDRVEAIITK
jgi:thiol-disulfide isomerase/thioredoxin